MSDCFNTSYKNPIYSPNAFSVCKSQRVSWILEVAITATAEQRGFEDRKYDGQ
jgi:hypothetical protein